MKSGSLVRIRWATFQDMPGKSGITPLALRTSYLSWTSRNTIVGPTIARVEDVFGSTSGRVRFASSSNLQAGSITWWQVGLRLSFPPFMMRCLLLLPAQSPPSPINRRNILSAWWHELSKLVNFRIFSALKCWRSWTKPFPQLPHNSRGCEGREPNLGSLIGKTTRRAPPITLVPPSILSKYHLQLMLIPLTYNSALVGMKFLGRT